MSSILVPEGEVKDEDEVRTKVRAYSDPVIFMDDRVLRTLLRKEEQYIPSNIQFVEQVEIKSHMRKEVNILLILLLL